MRGSHPNGPYPSGGGVYCREASPTLINCTIMGNVSLPINGRGGGLFCEENSSPTLINCLITNNRADGLGGGSWTTPAPLPTQGTLVGLFDYNDLATITTPIVVTGGAGFVFLTNDENADFNCDGFSDL